MDEQRARTSVLVTGASGFIGSRLVERLVEEHAEVHAVSRTKRPEQAGVRWWQADLANLDSARSLFASVAPDTVFNLAGLATSAPDLDLVPRMFQSNLATTVNVLTAAAETGRPRVLLAQSLTEPKPSETATSPYAVSKWAASGYARMFHTLYALPVVNLRIFMTYGRAQRDLAKLVPHVTLCLLRGDTPMLTSGQEELDWVYVDDVVEGCLSAARATGVEGRTVDLGSGLLSSVRDVVARLVDITGARVEPAFGRLEDRPRAAVRVADVCETKASIGWTARVDLDEGLRRTVAWYRELLDTATL